MEKIIPIKKYVKGKKIYFACKAINYRVKKRMGKKKNGEEKIKKEWDGDRPLSVYVDWKYNSNFIEANIILDKPLQKHANEIGENIRAMLKYFDINENNFHKLKQKLKDVRSFPPV